MDDRELRGLQIAATERLRYSKTVGWTVPSQTLVGTSYSPNGLQAESRTRAKSSYDRTSSSTPRDR